MRYTFSALTILLLAASLTHADSNLPAAIPSTVREAIGNSSLDMSDYVVPPQRVLWQSASGVENAEALLRNKNGQAVLSAKPIPTTVLKSTPDETAGILLDFGVEIQGYLELIVPEASDQTKMRQVRVRFGESAAETMADLGGPQNAGNDHAVRDQVVTLPWLGKKIVGPSGFRFVRIDNVSPGLPVKLVEVHAILQIRDVPYLGSFRCNDDRLNEIWQVGAYTVHLNMQEYLWDGIKRDRLVWVGDLHPEVSTINAVFGYNDVVPDSLDLIRDVTPRTQWMNGISSYSMWWVIIHEDWWQHHGDLEYLKAQQEYMTHLLRRLADFVGDDGKETLDGMRFLDWPTSEDQTAVHEGLQAMMLLTMQSGERLMQALGDEETAELCRQTADKLRQHVPEASGRKSPTALLSLAGLRNADEAADSVLTQGGPSDLSTFYGYYVLEALSKAGETDVALDYIRDFWGGMLDAGATTFWEEFDLKWAEDGGRIDELPPAGVRDIHGDFGDHCYVGFRRSLCHGWASGPTAWLSQHVLGIRPVAPGCTKVLIKPQLGDLQWAEGTYPTPKGPIFVRHERQADGTIRSEVQAPEGIEWEVASPS